MPTTFWWHSHFYHFCQLFSYGITRMWWRCCRCCGGAYGASFWLMFCLSCHWHLCEAFSLDPDFDYDNTEGLSSKVESHIGRSLRHLLANYTTSLQLLVEEVTNMTPCIYIWHRVYIYIYAYMIKVWFQTFVKCNVEAGFMATSIPFELECWLVACFYAAL